MAVIYLLALIILLKCIFYCNSLNLNRFVCLFVIFNSVFVWLVYDLTFVLLCFDDLILIGCYFVGFSGG